MLRQSRFAEKKQGGWSQTIVTSSPEAGNIADWSIRLRETRFSSDAEDDRTSSRAAFQWEQIHTSAVVAVRMSLSTSRWRGWGRTLLAYTF